MLTCTVCPNIMVPGREWIAIPREERREMIARGYSRQITKDLCSRCYTQIRQKTYTPPIRKQGYMGIPRHMKQIRKPGGIIAWVGDRPQDEEGVKE